MGRVRRRRGGGGDLALTTAMVATTREGQMGK
jgi:hypothetical protein